jgi:hypothetical protein
MAVLQVKIAKSFGSRATGKGAQFSNVYHVDTPNAMDSPALLAEVMALVAWEKSFHSAHVQFMQATVSTPEREPKEPFNPDTVRSIPLEGAGSQFGDTPIAQMTGADITMTVKHGATTGRSGIWRYRGVLREFDTEAAAGGSITFSGAQRQYFQDRVDTRSTTANFPKLVVMHRDKTSGAITSREITNFTVGGIMVTRRDRAHKKKKGGAEDADSMIGSLTDVVEGIAGGVLSHVTIEAGKKAIASGLLQRLLTSIPALLVDLGT